jgi:F5/8 type C domain-containing protein
MPEPGARAAAFAERAQASAELAKNLLAAAEPGEIRPEGNACEAYRQASYWALCALLAKTAPALDPNDSQRIWGALPEESLARAASDEQRMDALRNALSAGSFVYFAELPAAEQAVLVEELSKLTQALLVRLAERSAALDAVYLQRAWRMSLLALLALCLAMSPAAVKKVLEARSELSAGRPWRASSKADSGGCTSPAQQCAENTGYFFHTDLEPSPWVEFDLGGNRKISKVVVENRADCCKERAEALVIEVSNDQKRWRNVAHHDGEFISWEAVFTPVNGRYLRVRSTKQNYLHLAAVHIY